MQLHTRNTAPTMEPTARKYSLVLTSKGEAVSPDDLCSNLKSHLKPTEMKIGIHRIHTNKTGQIQIDLDSKKSKDIVSQFIANNDELSHKVQVTK